MNKPFCLMFCLVLLSNLSAKASQKAENASAKAQQSAENPINKLVKADVDAMNEAMVKNDLEKVLDLTHPKAIELGGGRKEMIMQMKELIEDMKAKGITFESGESDEPKDPVSSGSDLYILAPHTLILKVKGGRLRAKAFVIGVSSDKGKSWKYVNGSVGAETIKKVLPDLPKSLKLPEESKPVFERE